MKILTFREIFEAHLLEEQEKDYRVLENIIYNEIYEKCQREYLLEKFYWEYELEKMFEDMEGILREIEERERERQRIIEKTCLLREAVITPKHFGLNVENHLGKVRDLNEKTIRNAVFQVISDNHKAHDPFVIRSSGNNDVNNLNHTLFVSTEKYQNFIVQRLSNRIRDLNQDLVNHPQRRQQHEKDIAWKTYDVNHIKVDPQWVSDWFDKIHLTDQRLLEPNVLNIIREISKDLYANLPDGFEID